MRPGRGPHGPRELSLVRSGGMLRLRQRPAASLSGAGREILAIPGAVLDADRSIEVDVMGAIDLEMGLRDAPAEGSLVVEVLDGDDAVAEVVLHRPDGDGLEACLARLPLDLGAPGMDAAWVVPARIALGSMPLTEIRLLVDATSIELFADGLAASAVLPSPTRGQRRTRIRARGAAWPIERLACRAIDAADVVGAPGPRR